LALTLPGGKAIMILRADRAVCADFEHKEETSWTLEVAAAHRQAEVESGSLSAP